MGCNRIMEISFLLSVWREREAYGALTTRYQLLPQNYSIHLAHQAYLGYFTIYSSKFRFVHFPTMETDNVKQKFRFGSSKAHPYIQKRRRMLLHMCAVFSDNSLR